MKYFISSITVLVILSSRHSGLAAERGIASIAENSVESLKLTRALAAAHAAVVAADAELAKVRIASPALGNSSKNLTIGEFERVEQFESRKKIAREAAEVADKNAHKIALTAWQMSIDQRTAKLNAVKKSLDSLRKTTAIRMEELERVRTDVVAATYSPERRTLPLFDRDRMSFGVLEIQRLPEEIIDTQDNSMVTRLNFTFPKFEIELPTLEDGARFKEEYQASKLSFRWRFHPQLVRTESPIIDPGKTRVKEIDQVTVRSAGITLALVGVAVALGARRYASKRRS